ACRCGAICSSPRKRTEVHDTAKWREVAKAVHCRYSFNGFMEYWMGTAASVRLDVGRPDHLAPFFSFVSDELTEVGGRTGEHGATQFEQRLDLGVGEARIGLLVELVDNLGGRIPRCAEAPHCARFVARDELTHCGQVRQSLRALCGDHRQRAQ